MTREPVKILYHHWIHLAGHELNAKSLYGRWDYRAGHGFNTLE